MNRIDHNLRYNEWILEIDMDRIFNGLLVVIFSCNVLSAQNTTELKGSLLTWEKSSHEFDDIIQGEKVSHVFLFTNTGTEPLIITNVEVTCGCTIPKGWPLDAILPGNSGELEILFNSAGKLGKQNKVVNVVSNSIKGNSQITFSINVLPKKLN